MTEIEPTCDHCGYYKSLYSPACLHKHTHHPLERQVPAAVADHPFPWRVDERAGVCDTAGRTVRVHTGPADKTRALVAAAPTLLLGCSEAARVLRNLAGVQDGAKLRAAAEAAANRAALAVARVLDAIQSA